MESLVDVHVEYKYIRVNIVFPFHKLQDAERTSHCPPPPSYVTYLVRLAETLMTSFRVGVAIRKTARAALAGARTQSEWLLYTITIATVLLWAEFVKFCESFDLAMAASVNQDDLLEVLENEEGDTKLASGSLEWMKPRN